MLEPAILEVEPTNALLEASEPKCLVEFVYVYAVGQIPPGEDLSEAPDDFDLANSHFEDQKWEWSRVPEVGDTREWRSLEWNVAAVYPYLADDESKIYIAVCNQDKSVPQRQDWSSKQPLLYIPILLGGQVAENEFRETHFGLCDRHQDIPTRNIFEDWEFVDRQTFKPIGAKAPQEFREIVLCWCTKPLVSID